MIMRSEMVLIFWDHVRYSITSISDSRSVDTVLLKIDEWIKSMCFTIHTTSVSGRDQQNECETREKDLKPSVVKIIY